MLTHYETLRVSHSAHLGEIRKSYHRLSLLLHPDKTIRLPVLERSRREQMFKLVSAAFEVLSDPQKRRAYDKYIEARTKGDHRGSESFYGPQGVPRAPNSVHRFTESTLGEAPNFHWYHCQLNEYSQQTTLTYTNWLGWKFSLGVANHFKVTAKPVIPTTLVRDSIVIRLPLLRKPGNVPRTSQDIAVDFRGAPGNEHTVIYSALIESQAAGLEVVVELALAPDATLKTAQAPAKWTWVYDTDHEPLTEDTAARVTYSMFYPYKPSYVASKHREMPEPPYPKESPMYSLLMQFPGMKIEEAASDTYCLVEEQQGKCMWRLTATGSM